MMCRHLNVVWNLAMATCGAVGQGVAADATLTSDVAMPQVPGLDLKMGDTVMIRRGALMASMYGCYKSDTVPIEGFPPGLFKYRTIVVFSADRGRTWGNPVTVAYDPSIGHESFCEADFEIVGTFFTVRRQ